MRYLAANNQVSLHLTYCWAGVYSETAFEGLDMVINAAAQYGVRLIVTLSDSWNLVDSIKSVCACPVLHSPTAKEPHRHTSQTATSACLLCSWSRPRSNTFLLDLSPASPTCPSVEDSS